MSTKTAGQDIGLLYWTPAECEGWLTACAPLENKHQLLEVFQWALSDEDARSSDDNNEEAQAWAEVSRRSLARWAKENPY